MSMILAILSGVQIVKVGDGRITRRRLPPNQDSRVCELLELMGPDHRAYTHVHHTL